MTTNIESLAARQVLDSRGNPTVEVEVKTKLGTTRAITPSGASTGIYEAVELRDGGKEYGGKSVLKAVGNVRGPIAKKIVGMDVEDQTGIDRIMIELDGTKNKGNLGANATVAVSMAVCRAGALAAGLELYEYVQVKYKPKKKGVMPVPMLNVINGGKHAAGGLACQEIMIQPAKASGFGVGLMHSVEVYHELKKKIKTKFGGVYTNLGDEGGFVPPLKSINDAFSLIEESVATAGYTDEFVFALDVAASNVYENGKYVLDGKQFSSDSLTDYYLKLEQEHPLRSIEDGFSEEEFGHFTSFNSKTRYQNVGDDLLVTNPERIRKAIAEKSCNALLLKVNQIGTITESMEAARLAQDAGWNVVVSHRSGEAEDSFIADFSVGIGAGQIKTGAPARAERTCKYNQLLRIEERLGTAAQYFSPYKA